MNEKIKMEVPYFQAPNDIFEIGLISNEIIVYLYLARCGNNSTAFPSYKTIGEKTGTSRPTAMRIVKKLESIGLLYKESRKFIKETDEKQKVFNKSNVYVVQHDLSSLKAKGGITQILPLVSERDYPSITVIPYKELPINNYLNKELSYMVTTSDQRINNLNYNSKDEYIKDIKQYSNTNLTLEILSLFYDNYLQYNKNYNHYKIKPIDLHICTDCLLEIEEHLKDSYKNLNKVTVLKKYLNWYFQTNSKHNIKNFANIKTFNVFFITEYKKYVEKDDYFKGNGDIKTSF